MHTLDTASDVPLHRQVEAALRRLIGLPKYQHGEMLPDELSLAREMGVSRGTVRLAISRLVQEGLLQRRRGVGTRVVNTQLRTGLQAWASFTGEMEARGIAVETYETELGMLAPDDPAIVQAFDLAGGIKLWRLRRLRGYAGEPTVHFESWFHPRLGITGNEDFDRPLYRVMAEACGAVAQRSSERIEAAAAEPAMAEQLRVAPGTPLLVRRRVVYDSHDRPIEFAINHYRGDRFTYSIELGRDDTQAETRP